MDSMQRDKCSSGACRVWQVDETIDDTRYHGRRQVLETHCCEDRRTQVATIYRLEQSFNRSVADLWVKAQFAQPSPSLVGRCDVVQGAFPGLGSTFAET